MIETVAETGSTNDDLLARARAGAPEGLWLRAERQRGGRGRLGRQWLSPAGNLYASTLVRLRESDPAAAMLALVTGLAAHDAVAPHLATPRPELKWPNDLLVGGAKLAGILLERSGDAVVAGIGINVAQAPDVPGRATVAMHRCGASAALTPAMLVEDLAAAFARRLADWRSEGLEATIEAWQQRAHPLGAPVRIAGGDGTVLTGVFDGLDETGAFRLRDGEGKHHIVHAGDVELIAERGE